MGGRKKKVRQPEKVFIQPEVFKNEINRLFTSLEGGRVSEADKQSPVCYLLFYETHFKPAPGYIAQKRLAELAYPGNSDLKVKVDALRRTIQRMEKRFDEYFNEKGKTILGCKLVVHNIFNEDRLFIDEKGKPVRSGYWLELVPVKPSEIPKQASVKKPAIELHMGLYTGRNAEVDRFQSILDNMDSNLPGNVLSIYGFGGIGKTTLLKIYRDIASNTSGVIVRPDLPRSQIVADSFNDWLSDVMLFEAPESTKSHDGKRQAEKWHDLLERLEDGTVVFIDTAATVNLKELGKSLGLLDFVLREEKKKCLIVVATRASLHRFSKIELSGLSEKDIRLLKNSPGWPDDVSRFAKMLRDETDGNPLMIESICKDESLWERFKSKKLVLSRHAKPIAYLLKEMWDSLSPESQEALGIAAMLSSYANKWKYTWGREECLAVVGPAWDDSAFELISKCFIKEPEPDIYSMHDLITEFAMPRLCELSAALVACGDHFSYKNKNEIAIRFYSEAEQCLPKRSRKATAKPSKK